MKRKRWSLGALIGALVVAMFAVYGQWLGALSIPLAWVALIGAAIAANRILTCPACSKRLGSVFQKTCSHCGAALADQGIFIAAKDRPAERAALEYMEESRRILQRWAGIRQMLGKAVYIVASFFFGGDVRYAGRGSLHPRHLAQPRPSRITRRRSFATPAARSWREASGPYWLNFPPEDA